MWKDALVNETLSPKVAQTNTLGTRNYPARTAVELEGLHSGRLCPMAIVYSVDRWQTAACSRPSTRLVSSARKAEVKVSEESPEGVLFPFDSSIACATGYKVDQFDRLLWTTPNKVDLDNRFQNYKIEPGTCPRLKAKNCSMEASRRMDGVTNLSQRKGRQP